MATKNFRSTVLDPTSEFAYGDKLRFTALSSINQVFKRSFSEVTIGVDGVYDIDLQYGKYRIDYKPYEGIWALFANVEVGAETTATSLQDLAMTSSPVTDDTILALQAILEETKVNAENAEKSSIDSIAAATEAAQDRDEIEGLMLRAMTTADVEAIRESNKNLFAASGVVEWGTVGSEPVNPKRGGLNCIDESNILLIDGKYHIAGLTFEIPKNSGVIFPEAPDGTVTYNKSTGVVIQHATFTEAFAAADADVNIEVVVNRVDLNCLEYYLRAVTEADPFIYPDGDIHSQSASMAGVATTLDDARPDSYFANFIGQTDVIRGKGVNWFTATSAEKLKILSESNEHGFLHYDPATAEWRQWCLRKRTVAGAGNGDLLSINSSSSALLLTSKKGVTAQADSNAAGSRVYQGASGWSGVFSSVSDGGLECYLYVVSSHPRINKSAYHQSHNGMGGQKFAGALYWHQTTLGTSLQTTVANSDTAIASGRPDNKLYNKIYPSGQGGTIDYRMTAYETGTAEVMESVLSEVYAGTYRGKQYLTRVATKYNGKIVTCTKTSNAEYNSGNMGGTVEFSSSDGDGECNWQDQKNAAWYVFGDNGNAMTLNRHTRAKGADFLCTSFGARAYLYNVENEAEKFNELFPNGTALTFMALQETDVPVSGDFTQIDVVGGYVDVLASPQLANGWLGSYTSPLESGRVPATRKSLQADGKVNYTYTTDNGNSWTVADAAFNAITNDKDPSVENSVGMMTYPAFAKQTKVSTIKPTLNGSAGLSNVHVVIKAQDLSGCIQESLIGKVNVNITNTYLGANTLPILNHTLTGDDKLYGYSTATHSPIISDTVTNDSPCVKFLPYQIADNGQTSIGFFANELKWTTDFGDDSKINPVNGTSTYIDLNDNQLLCASHELSMPIGYTKKG